MVSRVREVSPAGEWQSSLEAPGVPERTGSSATGFRSFLGRHRATVLLLVVLSVVAVAVVRGIHIGEFNFNIDEAHHAFTGIYVADLLRDHPLSHPLQYTYLYYARFPVLGLIHWPPFFYVVEGVLFLLLGPSVVTARLAVLLFTLFGLFFWFRLVRELLNDWAAAASTVLMALVPFFLFFEKTVMLEVPSLALAIAATYYWLRYLRTARGASLYAFAILAALAMLTRWQSIYLLPFCILTIALERKFRQLLNWTTLKAFLLSFVLVVPYYTLTFALHWGSIKHAFGKGPMHTGPNPYLYYWLVPPQQVGWPLLILSLFGVVTWKWWAKRESIIFMLSWIAACYLTFTMVSATEVRYGFDWIPAFIFLGVGPLTAKWFRSWMRVASAAILVVLLVAEAWKAWGYKRPELTGYAEAASWLAKSGKPGIILYDGNLCANFCFFLRVDSSRRFVVLRKLLYADLGEKSTGGMELVSTRRQLEDVIREYGVRYVLLEEGQPLDYEIQKTLREYLQQGPFKLAETITIRGNYPSWQANTLLLYENENPASPKATTLKLTMFTLPYDIVVPLDKLLSQ